MKKFGMVLSSIGCALVLASCGDEGGGGSGGSGNSVAAKGQKVKLSPSQTKVIKANADAGSVGFKGVSTNVNSSTSLNLLPKNEVLALALPGEVFGMAATSGSQNVNQSFNFDQPCGLSGTEKISGSMSVVKTGDKSGELSVSVDATADKCESANGLVNGAVKFSLNIKGQEKTGKLTASMSGSTTATIDENGQKSSHTLAFKGFSTTLNVDEDLANAANQPNKSKADQQALLKKLGEKTECSGSIVIDTQEISCADLVQTGIDLASEDLKTTAGL